MGPNGTIGETGPAGHAGKGCTGEQFISELNAYDLFVPTFSRVVGVTSVFDD